MGTPNMETMLKDDTLKSISRRTRCTVQKQLYVTIRIQEILKRESPTIKAYSNPPQWCILQQNCIWLA